MRQLAFCLSLSLVCNVFICSGQATTNPKFNVIAEADFKTTISSVTDSSTDAVIIADVGVTEFKGNNKAWVSYVFKHTTRIKILNKRAFDLATVKIPVYTGYDGKVEIDNISAVTYNLENGSVVASKMDKKDLFTDNVTKGFTEYKFTLPAVKENCIIEYSYTITSDLFQYLPSWKFQNARYPCLWSEYEITIPDLLVYLVTKRGLHPYFFYDSETGRERYLVKRTQAGALSVDGQEALSVSVNTKKHHWVIRNSPSFMTDNYVSSAENYIDKIDFQLIQTSNGEDMHSLAYTWNGFANTMLNAGYFAAFVNDPEGNSWLDKPLSTIINDATDQLQQAKNIYYYLAGNITCSSYNNIYVRSSLQDVFKNKKGNVGEINLLLTDMLLRRNIKAAPVVLSTRGNGYNNAVYPFADRLNYTICKAIIDGKVYYLDASHSKLGFGQLPSYCYNGFAKVISKDDTEPVYLLADSIMELQTTSVRIFKDPQNKGALQGGFEDLLGPMNSFNFRESTNESDQKKYFSDLQAAAGNDLEITSHWIDSLNKPEYPLNIKASFNIKPAVTDGIIYFTPVFLNAYKTNPFSAAERKYPVEMAYPVNQEYAFTMEIPDGFVVDEIPKSAKISYKGNEGFFEYNVQKDEAGIQLKSTIRLKKAYFDPNDYSSLREFFAFVAKKTKRANRI